MTYKPQVNDYVKWKNDEGWVYYVDPMNDYFNIEVGVKDIAVTEGKILPS
mgnify:CR=1 FL=1